MPDSVAVTTIAALCLVNIALTLGVIRRLNAHTRLLGRGGCSGGQQPPPIPEGSMVGDFQATTIDGEPLSRADLRGTTLVGFMTPGCPSCEDSLPAFVARAATTPGSRDRSLAVVLGSPETAREMCEQLAPVARVVTEDEEHGQLVRAFHVDGLPAFALLAGDTVVASHPLPERLPAEAPQTAPT